MVTKSNGPTAPIAATEAPKLKVPSSCADPVQASSTGFTPSPSVSLPAFARNVEGALHWHEFGFNSIPTVPTAKRTVGPWDEWLHGLSAEKITKHWLKNPEHEVGLIVGDGILVLDADSAESIAALAALEKARNVIPSMVVKTTKGEHHYFRRAKGTFAKSDSHSTKEFPDRLDVKTGRALVILPPSTGKILAVCDAKNASELAEVGQDFIDAIFQHNGRPAPRPSEITMSASDESDAPGNNMGKLTALLEHISSDCGYDDWLRILMAVYHETGGSEDGFNIANDWSSNGKSYKGEKDIRTKWNSFKSGTANPITIATIVKMAKENGADLSAIYAASGEQFEPCVTEVILPSPKSTNVPGVVNQPVAEITIMNDADKQTVLSNPLDQYSLRGKLAELNKMLVATVYVLMNLALLGQITVFYAWPNTGKTLIILHLLIEAIISGRIDPAKLYYINMDDSHKGLTEKLALAEEHGFNVLADGHQEFSVYKFAGVMQEMIETDCARGVIIVLDTLKKFTDVMDKTKSSNFGKLMRRFSLKGGTVIALAHANKKPGADGKPIPGGTSDIKDDSDCAFIMWAISDEAGRKVIQFENVKRRGNVAETTAYSYSTERGISYEQLLASVQPVGDEQIENLKLSEVTKTDAEIISAITACISEGINSKMKLAEAVSSRTGISRGAAIQVIERYTGTDHTLHNWSFRKGARGAMLYALLATPQAEVALELLGNNQPSSDTAADGGYDAPAETIQESSGSTPAHQRARALAPPVKVGGIWSAGPSGHHPAAPHIAPPEGT